ncbi:MAG: dTDP-4-dehydrorhamnose 3,5-epimerase family protein [Rhodoluna sp.]|nr:dTDP-4-dehydrorhamnose 3,5-epimerase family protein [Rhodoluna sp.]
MVGIQRAGLKGAQVINHEMFYDSRGYFKYAFQAGDLMSGGVDGYEVRQVNHSYSLKNVLRGIHREPWQKVIYVPSGIAEICVVNLILGHEEFADYFLITVGDFVGGRKAVYVPQGFGNAFHCLEDTHYINLVSKKFKDEGRLGARWDDPLLQINWTHARDPILSAQDMAWHPLGDRINDFDGVGNAL